MVNFRAGIGKNLFCGAFILLTTASYLHSGFVIDIDFQHIALIQLLQGIEKGAWITPPPPFMNLFPATAE